MEIITKKIDTDQIWSRVGNVSCCTEYVYYAKIKRKYLNYINDNVEKLSEGYIGNKFFSDSKSFNARRIHYIVKYIDKFDVYDLQELLSEDYSTIDFLKKTDEIRKRNINISTEE